MTKMNIAQQVKAPRGWSPNQSLLRRKCACNTRNNSGEECAECKKKKQTLQRVSHPLVGRGQKGEGAIPPIVNEVLQSPGRPLDANARAFMEPRFGQDFSQVRVHTGANALASADAVNALAYTVGRDIVFGRGELETDTVAGRHLLAHELAHTVQQGGNAKSGVAATPLKIGSSSDPEEIEADAVAGQISGMGGGGATVTRNLVSVPPTLSRIDCTTLTYKTCKPYSCGYGGSGVCGWGGIANGCRCMGATKPSARRVLEVLLIIGISITLLATILLALVDPEPATKLGLAGLSAAQIALLLTMLGYESHGENTGSDTASLGGDASAVNPENVA